MLCCSSYILFQGVEASSDLVVMTLQLRPACKWCLFTCKTVHFEHQAGRQQINLEVQSSPCYWFNITSYRLTTTLCPDGDALQI